MSFIQGLKLSLQMYRITRINRMQPRDTCAISCVRTSNITTTPNAPVIGQGLTANEILRCRSSADCTIITSGTNFRQAQLADVPFLFYTLGHGCRYRNRMD